MNSKAARLHLNLYRPGDEADESRSAQALEVLKRDAGLWSEFEQDQSVDQSCRSLFSSLNASGEMADALEADLAEIQARKRAHRLSLADPGVLAVALGFLLVLGLGVWIFLADSDKFSGYDEATALSSQATQLDAGQFEPVETELSELNDWFAMNGLERFWVPPVFAQFRSIGARVMRFQNVPVAQIAIPDRKMMVLIFNGQPLGISIPEGEWRFIEGSPYSSAITEKDGICFLVSIRGTKADVERLIAEVQGN